MRRLVRRLGVKIPINWHLFWVRCGSRLRSRAYTHERPSNQNQTAAHDVGRTVRFGDKGTIQDWRLFGRRRSLWRMVAFSWYAARAVLALVILLVAQRGLWARDQPDIFLSDRLCRIERAHHYGVTVIGSRIDAPHTIDKTGLVMLTRGAKDVIDTSEYVETDRNRTIFFFREILSIFSPMRPAAKLPPPAPSSKKSPGNKRWPSVGTKEVDFR
jgi:hypothetical protein